MWAALTGAASPLVALRVRHGETPMTITHYLGITQKWGDGTAVGGCSFMIHVRHAAAAITSGLCETVLITHGESGRSGVGRTRNVVAPTSLAGSPLPSLPRKRAHLCTH